MKYRYVTLVAFAFAFAFATAAGAAISPAFAHAAGSAGHTHARSNARTRSRQRSRQSDPMMGGGMGVLMTGDGMDMTQGGMMQPMNGGDGRPNSAWQ